MSNFINVRESFLSGAFFALALIVLPNASFGQCKNWEFLNSYLGIEQRGTLSTISVRVTQKGNYFTGSVETSYIEPGFLGNPVTEIKGDAEGTISSDSVSFKIFWQGGLTGVYTAKILPSGKLEGETYDKAKPSAVQTWHSSGTMTCATLKSASTGILKPSGKTSGLYKDKGPKKFDPPPAPGGSAPASGPANSPPTPSPMKVPGIVASRVYFGHITDPAGFVILAWDAGPKHTYAEVWFKINNGDDIFLVEQGKGTRQFPVERGKYYTFILTDEGRTLATVSVAGQ
jgi:hypothetical protein